MLLRKLRRITPISPPPASIRIIKSPVCEELSKLSALLSNSLDNYVNVCAKMRDHYFQERTIDKLDEVLDRVANELQLLASYGEKLTQAGASMKVVRNSSPTVVPISRLPPEIMTRVFHIILNDQPEPLDATGAPFRVSLSFPKHPETLSHVCFGWRRIAIASHTLWNRIDLVLHNPLGPAFLARAKLHVDRARNLALDVRMIDPTVGIDLRYGRQPYDFEDFDFLAFNPTPISSLSLVSYYGLREEHCNFIYYCLANCAQQTLEQLVIWDVRGRGGPCHFIESVDNPHDPKSLQIDLPKESLDNIWHSTSVMRLAGLYPHWTSRAYHNLVDLRLGSEMLMGGSISEARMVDILKASPRLRVFHLHFDTDDPLPENAPILPIQLNELESLNLSTSGVNPSQILRFIAPGQKPLQLSIIYPPTDVVERFLRRSNVTQLRMVAWGNYPPVNALRLCPNLHTLVLDVWGSTAEANLQTAPEGDESDMTSPMPLKSLYLLRCDGIGLNDLKKIVERHSVQELTLWRTYPTITHEHSSNPRIANKSDASQLCAMVNYLGESDRRPTDDWDLF